jgi:hypothetical protein
MTYIKIMDLAHISLFCFIVHTIDDFKPSVVYIAYVVLFSDMKAMRQG